MSKVQGVQGSHKAGMRGTRQVEGLQGRYEGLREAQGVQVRHEGFKAGMNGTRQV